MLTFERSRDDTLLMRRKAVSATLASDLRTDLHRHVAKSQDQRFNIRTSCVNPSRQISITTKTHPPRPAPPTTPNVEMAVDPLSPIACARIRALLLPVGRIKRSRFLKYVELLQRQSLVRLGDISPDSRPDRSTNP